jgi:hypothetical protein
MLPLVLHEETKRYCQEQHKELEQVFFPLFPVVQMVWVMNFHRNKFITIQMMYTRYNGSPGLVAGQTILNTRQFYRD